MSYECRLAGGTFVNALSRDRSCILPDEQYYDSQQAAAMHFGIDQSTVSRQLAVLIENGAIIVIKDTTRGADGFWTSKVIKIIPPPDDPQAFLHAEQVGENKDSASTCRNTQCLLSWIFRCVARTSPFRVATVFAQDQALRTPASAVVTKSVTAVGYQVGAGGTKVDFKGTELKPEASGEAKVEIKSSASSATLGGHWDNGRCGSTMVVKTSAVSWM